MATQSPFSLLEGFLQNLLPPDFQPPHWAVDELQRRLVLLLNHVLRQEPEAMRRLVRQQGRVVLMRWRSLNLKLMATPAGLLDRASDLAKPDLVLLLTEESALGLMQGVLSGDKPAVRIEGDVQLAAEVNWLVDHVRWDIEEDTSQLIGDVPARALTQAATSVAQGLRRFLGLDASAGPGAGSP